LAARGIEVSYETVRQWGLKFGEVFVCRIRQRAPQRGDKWHLDEVVITIAGRKHWLWRAVDQQGFGRVARRHDPEDLDIFPIEVALGRIAARRNAAAKRIIKPAND